MHGIGEIGQHLHRLGAGQVQRREALERACGAAADEVVEQIEDPAAVGKPEHRTDAVGRDLARPHRDRLVEDRKAVAHRAFGGTRDQVQGIWLGAGAFRLDDAGEVTRQLRHLDATQVEALAA